MSELTELIARAPWREAVTYTNTWPHEYVLIVSSQPGMPNPASQRCHDAARADDAVAPGTGAVTMEPRRAGHGQSNRSSVTTLEESMILMSLAAACRRER